MSIKWLLLPTLFLIIVEKAMAQDAIDKKELSALLASYYAIKDDLVNGNPTSASINATHFIKTLNSIDYKVISEGNTNILLADVTLISDAKDINKQRAYFSNFSDNMIRLAKAIKLTDEPIYEVYCPMKKVYWLSNDKTIKNPYYGSSMLSCGTIEETIK